MTRPGWASVMVAAAVAALAASGCSRRDTTVNPQNPLWIHRASGALSLVFRQPLVADQGLTAQQGAMEKSRPAIDLAGRRLFVGTSDGGLYALRAGDGSVLWRFQAGSSVQSEPLYDPVRDRVYFGADDGALYGVTASEGKLVFRYRAGVEVQRRPLLVDRPNGRSLILFVNAADSLFAIDADSFATRWKHLRTPAMGLEIAGHAGLTVEREWVFASFSTGKVLAYDIETGVERWEVDLAATGSVTGEEQQYFDADTTPVVIEDRVYVASTSTGVFALDVTSGAQVWHRAEVALTTGAERNTQVACGSTKGCRGTKLEGVSWLAPFTEPAHTDRATMTEVPARSILIASSGTTGLWALDPRTGDVLWRRDTPRGAMNQAVQVAGALLCSSSKLGLFLIEPRMGLVIDGINPATGFASSPAVAGRRAFVLTNRGVLLGLEIASPWRGSAPVYENQP